MGREPLLPYHRMLPSRGVGWLHADTSGYRYGKWKLTRGSTSCDNDDCKTAQLFDLDADIEEQHDVARVYPDVMMAISANITSWYKSVQMSRSEESKCGSNTGKVRNDLEWLV